MGTSVGTLTSLDVADDVTIYKASNNGNPVISLGSASTDRLKITASYTTDAQTLATVDFDTASQAAGTYKFKIKGTEEMSLVSGALNLPTGSVYKLDGTSVLSENTLGSGVTSSSLTSVGTLTSLSVSGT